MAQLKLMKKEWFNWFKGTTLENITAWTEYYYINPDSQHWISNYQLWDEEWEVGGYYTATGLKDNATNRIRNKNPIHALPNSQIFAPSSVFWIFCYDANMTYLGRASYVSTTGGYIWTTLDNTAFVNFESNEGITTYSHDICINRSNPTFNGHYEPWIIKIEDILGVVDLGTLNWAEYDPNTKIWVATNNSYKPITDADRPMIYGFCPKYVTKNYDSVGQTEDKTINLGHSYYQIAIKDTSYSDAASFKQAMNGAYLIYIKANSPLG